MNSDSDSDDDLLLSATFANPNRRQQNKEARVKEQHNSILNMALQNSDRMAEYARRLTLAKQQQQQQGDNDDKDDDDENTNADPRSARGTAKKAPRGTLTSTKKTPARNGTPASLGGVYDLDGKDQDEVLPIERRQQLAKAYATEGSSCLGTRMIISFDVGKAVSSSPSLQNSKWTSPEQAIQELERILSCFEKENSVSPDIDNIVKSLRTAIDLSVLPDFLMEKRLFRKLFTESSSMPPPTTANDDNISPLLSQLATWLYCTVTSAGLMMTSNLAQGALVTLIDLVKKGKLPLQMRQSPISYLVAEVLCWINNKDVLPYDMATKESASNDSDGKEAATAVPMDIDYLPHGLSTTKNNNETGLLNLLLFWEQLILSWSPPPPGLDLEAASSVIVILCRLALDPMAVSNRHEMYLFPLLQRVVSAILHLVESHAYDRAAKYGVSNSQCDSAFDEWMDQTVRAVFGKDLAQVGTRLGMKGEKSMDEDDDKASLCYASTLRLIPIHRSDGKAEETHKLSVEFKARLAMRALELLCYDGKEHISKGDTTIQGFSTDQASQQAKREMPPLAWTAYSAVLSAMSHLNVLGENIARQGPRSLATVECTTMLFETVLILLNGAAEGWDKEEYTPEQASVVVEMLQTVDQETEKLNKHVKRNTMANSHARRMDHHFSCWTQYYRVMMKRALRLTGDAEKIERQSKITDFMLSSP